MVAAASSPAGQCNELQQDLERLEYSDLSFGKLTQWLTRSNKYSFGPKRIMKDTVLKFKEAKVNVYPSSICSDI